MLDQLMTDDDGRANHYLPNLPPASYQPGLVARHRFSSRAHEQILLMQAAEYCLDMHGANVVE